MAKLYFKYGAMGSSKTAQALITRYNYEENDMRVWLIKPSADVRDGADILRSRIGLEAKVDVMTPETDVYEQFAGEHQNNCHVVIVDEAYADFAKTNCVSLATDAKNRNLIVMRTFSKSFSLAGLRVGYSIGPEDLIDALYKVKDSYNADAVAQSVALAALNDLPWMRNNAAKVKRTRARVAKELARRGWNVLPSESNFLFARPAHRPAAELFDALRKMNIFVRYFKGARTGDRLRITIGTDAEMDTLLNALSSLDA